MSNIVGIAKFNTNTNTHTRKQQNGGRLVSYYFGFVVLLFIIIRLLEEIAIPMSNMQPILDLALNETNADIASMQQEYASSNCDATQTYSCENTLDLMREMNATLLFLNNLNRGEETSNIMALSRMISTTTIMPCLSNMPIMTIVIIILNLITGLVACRGVMDTGRGVVNASRRVVNASRRHDGQQPSSASPRAAILRLRPLDINPDLDDDAPDAYKDLTFTMTIMRDPVVATDGFTYERESIERWLREHDTSPVTRAVMPNNTLIPNISLRGQIIEWCQIKTAAAAAAAAAARKGGSRRMRPKRRFK